jgi:hypothetical protein
MDTLNISTGEKRLAVSVDGVNGRELVFNPNDVLFMERLHRFYRVVMDKAREWEAKLPELNKQLAAIPTDDNGMPEEIDTATAPLKEMNEFMRTQIDTLFGVGISQAIYGDTVFRNPEIYVTLVQGIQDFIQPARAEKMKKYIAPKPPRKRAAKKN